MGFCEQKLDIVFQNWDEEYYFVLIRYNQRNIALNMGICEFVSDCEWWGYDDVKLEKKENQLGWLFNKKAKKKDIIWQIDGYLRQNDYLCK